MFFPCNINGSRSSLIDCLINLRTKILNFNSLKQIRVLTVQSHDLSPNKPNSDTTIEKFRLYDRVGRMITKGHVHNTILFKNNPMQTKIINSRVFYE